MFPLNNAILRGDAKRRAPNTSGGLRMKRLGRHLPLFALTMLVSSLANATDLPSINGYGDAPSLRGLEGSSAHSEVPSAIVTSKDEKRDVPSFLWASSDLRVAPPH